MRWLVVSFLARTRHGRCEEKRKKERSEERKFSLAVQKFSFVREKEK